jgi:hypothetical protein
MIDIRKALSQRCYIIFDSNQQLQKFVKEHELKIFVGIYFRDKVIRIIPNETIGYSTMEKYKMNRCKKELPTYHHTELTITDDGE